MRGAADAGAAPALSRRCGPQQAPAGGPRRARSSRRSSRRGSRRLGARRMAGVATNLAAMLDERYRRQGYEHITERNECTLAEAIRLLAREALTGARRRPRRGMSSIPGGRSSKARSAGIWSSSTAPSTTRTPMRGRRAADPGSRPRSRRGRGRVGERRAAGAARNRGRERERRARAPPPGAQASLEGAPADGEAEDAQDASRGRRGRNDARAGDDDPGRPGRPGMLPRGRRRRYRDLSRLHHRCPTRWSRPTSCAMPTS